MGQHGTLIPAPITDNTHSPDPGPGVTASSVAWWLLSCPRLFSQLPPGSPKSPSVGRSPSVCMGPQYCLGKREEDFKLGMLEA